MADITNKEDYAHGFGAAMALLGVCIFIGAGIYVVRGGDISKLNPLKSIQDEQIDDSRPFRLNLRREADGSRSLKLESKHN